MKNNWKQKAENLIVKAILGFTVIITLLYLTLVVTK